MESVSMFYQQRFVLLVRRYRNSAISTNPY